MKAYVLNRYGEEEKLQLRDLPTPKPSENELLIEIHSASINPIDLKIKSGKFKLMIPYKFPLILGHDLSGIVVGVGTKVTRFKVGDEVYTRPHNVGSFAEYIAVSEDVVALKPTNITFEEAASVPLVALTAWQALVDRAQLKKGDKLFIQAGSGGVGTYAIQIAKYLGATVATTTSAKNSELVKSLGADVVIDYKNQNFEDLLSNYDIVLNTQDEKTLEKSMNILKKGGKVVSISGPLDANTTKQMKLSWFARTIISLMSRRVINKSKELNIDYSFIFMMPNAIQLTEISNMIERGIIRPVVDQIFPFEQINQAVDYLSTGRAKGKVVIKIK
ncbi:MAG: NADP-dependent oxidoreductase [Bacteroidales bacterium]